MNATISKSKFNQSLECVRMIAAVFVVFIHVPFPGEAGSFVTCLARFAVPFFFAVSGYFCFGITLQQIRGRFLHIVKLNLLAIAAVLACECMLVTALGGSTKEVLQHAVPQISEVSEWIFLHINPFGGHLWYLTAIGVCYGIVWIYSGFFGAESQDFRVLYLTGFFLFLIRFAVSDILTIGGMEIPYYLFRDGIFIGFPMFAMGMFLRQYQQRIIDNYRLTFGKLTGLLLFGILLSLIQWKGLSIQELPLGAVVQVAALILLTAQKPDLCGSSKLIGWIISQFRFLATWIYILHLSVMDAYEYFFQSRFIAVFGSREDWLRPIAVLGATIVICQAGQLAGNVLHRRKK